MRIRKGLLLAALVVAIGCDSKKDLNKDLKPIDPNTPPPQMGSDNSGGGEKKNREKNDGAPPVIK